MLEYYSNRLCIPARELIERGVMSSITYKNSVRRGKVEVARTARGLGNYALVAVESLPEQYREAVKALYPEGGKVRLLGWLRSNYETDQAAAAWFMDLCNTGIALPPERIKEYVTNASVLNTCIRLYENTKAVQRTMGERYSWEQMASAIEGLREEFGHTLPASVLRFRKKVSEYRRDGYGCLVSGKYGNQCARKVDYKTERAILAIAVLPNKPYNTTVGEMYNMFVCGELELYDPQTGEILNPDDYTDKYGEPLSLSETTINNYLNKPKNRILVEHATTSYMTFMHEQMPHVHRHAPEFSLSKVSFDDRDLPRKLKDTKMRPKAYYAYDVASQCVIGVAYNRSKNVDIVTDCFRDMFRLIDRKGWGCPAQVEVENHLMSQWRDSFLSAGVMFPFVRFCAPENSQEKYAEALNGAKKRSVEHRNHLGIGRFYAKDRHYKTESKKIFDSANDTYEDKEYYSWEELIAEDRADVEEFNNRLHPNQKRYKGMTRRQVLEANLNPTLEPVNKVVLARYIGEHVETSVRRNSYCRINYEDWWLSRTEVIDKLSPNNYKVDAYYLTDAEGRYDSVYIYQGGTYIDTLQKVGTFNSADSEQTDEDRDIMLEQQKKIAHFERYVKDRAVTPVGVLKHTVNDESEAVAVASSEPVPAPVDRVKKDYSVSALEQL